MNVFTTLNHGSLLNKPIYQRILARELFCYGKFIEKFNLQTQECQHMSLIETVNKNYGSYYILFLQQWNMRVPITCAVAIFGKTPSQSQQYQLFMCFSV